MRSPGRRGLLNMYSKRPSLKIRYYQSLFAYRGQGIRKKTHGTTLEKMKNYRKTMLNAVDTLSLFCSLGEMTQNQVTEIFHLRRTSVFYIFEFLAQKGLIFKEEVLHRKKGRPSNVWKLNKNGGTFLVAYLTSSGNIFGTFDF